MNKTKNSLMLMGALCEHRPIILKQGRKFKVVCSRCGMKTKKRLSRKKDALKKWRMITVRMWREITGRQDKAPPCRFMNESELDIIDRFLMNSNHPSNWKKR